MQVHAVHQMLLLVLEVVANFDPFTSSLLDHRLGLRVTKNDPKQSEVSLDMMPGVSVRPSVLRLGCWTAMAHPSLSGSLGFAGTTGMHWMHGIWEAEGCTSAAHRNVGEWVIMVVVDIDGLWFIVVNECSIIIDQESGWGSIMMVHQSWMIMVVGNWQITN